MIKGGNYWYPTRSTPEASKILISCLNLFWQLWTNVWHNNKKFGALDFIFLRFNAKQWIYGKYFILNKEYTVKKKIIIVILTCLNQLYL